MSDSEIKEFGLARLKEDINIDEDGRFVDHLEEGSKLAHSKGHIVLVTKMPSPVERHDGTVSSDTPKAMLQDVTRQKAMVSIDLGSIERLRTIRVSLEKLEAWPGIHLDDAEAEKQGWITDLESRCKDEYAEIYTVGTNLEYKATNAKSDTILQRNYKKALGRAWKEGDPIRLISNGMVNSEENPGYIGYVKTKNPVPGYLWGTYEPKPFMILPPESLQVVPSQESQELQELPESPESPELQESLEPQAFPENITFGQAAAAAAVTQADPGLSAPLLPEKKGGGRKRKRKTKRRRTKRKTKQKRTKKRGTKRR